VTAKQSPPWRLAVEAEAAKGNVLETIAAREPILTATSRRGMQSISGKLALAGVPPQALQVFFELWKGVDLTMLARPRRGRRARGQGRPRCSAAARVR